MIKRVLTQVSRTAGGLTLYAWKKTGVVDPHDEVAIGFYSGGTVGDGLPQPQATPLSGALELVGVQSLSEGDDVVWLPEGSNPPSGYEAWMMNHSLVGTTSGDKKGRWAVCYECQCEFPISKMRKIKGKWYCEEDAE